MALKNKPGFTLLAVIVMALISLGFITRPAETEKLPFAISYNHALKQINHEHQESYDYTEYSAGDDIVQLKHYHNVNRQSARKIIEDRKFFISYMFKEQPSPYPGALSSTIACPDSLVPVPHLDTVALSLHYKLLATRNLIYGNCNTKDNYYTCVYCVFFCAAKNELFELKIFTPVKAPSFDYNKLVASLRCGN
jgi:hypothetical protein